MALAYNKYAPDGATKRTEKICNARWNQAALLVSKWYLCVGETYQINLSGENEETTIQLAHELHNQKVHKRFDLIHWWLLLKDIPKWEALCAESAEIASKCLKINEIGTYSDNSIPGTLGTLGTPGTPSNILTLEAKIHQLKKGVIYST